MDDDSRFAPHDVLATFDTMDAARDAVQGLQLAGVEASRISLFGPAADEAAADLSVAEADAGFAGEMWRRTWIGAAVGSALGMIVGGAIAFIVLRGAGPDSVGVFWAAVAGTGVLGLGTGAATGATSAAQMSRAWELTFHPVLPGQVGVGVHTVDPAEATRAERALQRHGPSQLERFDV
ncbi:MAG: hypothetical protein KY437_03935 [Actinobacteria bacterium]|nr:hypothetical protein [Actinomycetota bacterium]